MSRNDDPVDILVVGAGASGAPFAWSMASSGFKVMCLEQGKWHNPDNSPSYNDDWELGRLADFNPDPNIRSLQEDYPIDTAKSPISPLMYNGVGGTTLHWTAHFPRFHPSDFRSRTLDNIGDDWPISYRVLEPFYNLNDGVTGISGLAGDPAYPAKPPRQTPPLAIGKPATRLAGAFDKLGWHWWPADSAIISEKYHDRRPCNYCGPCDLGCPPRARASVDVTYWPLALAHGATLKTRSRVREVTLSESGRANGVLYYDDEGQLKHQRASVVVLACNGIGTPRLLLNSTSGKFPHGLANSSNLVGRNLMLHIVAITAGVFDEDMEAHKGPHVCSIYSHEFYETDPSRGFLKGYGLQVLRSSGPVSTSLGGYGERQIAWGIDHHRTMAQISGRECPIAIMGEDIPEQANRIELHPSLTDSDGIPAPSVFYALNNNGRRLLDHGIDRAAEALLSAGATDIKTTPLARYGTGHQMGTAKMGNDPSSSVVDRRGRCHDIDNLLIIDGSIFVTAAAVNPTSTIQALALYIANSLKNSARSIPST